LVVDDEPDALDLIARVLADAGAEVAVARSAEEALDRVARGPPPAVIVSDIGMPDVDGHELARRLRALPPERGGRTPAVALTAFARPEDRLRALAAGFQVHVAKPVDPAELLATVAGLVDLADTHRPGDLTQGWRPITLPT